MGWAMAYPMGAVELTRADRRAAVWRGNGYGCRFIPQNPCDPSTECDASKSPGRGAARRSRGGAARLDSARSTVHTAYLRKRHSREGGDLL